MKGLLQQSGKQTNKQTTTGKDGNEGTIKQSKTHTQKEEIKENIVY